MTDQLGPAPVTRRLFFALWPPADVVDGLGELAVAAAQRFGGQPSRRETLHMTLAFLGEVAESEIPALIAAGHRVAAAPFSLQIDRLGFWRHNRLLWAGCAPDAGLDALVAALGQNLAAAGHALPGRSRAFTPHLTLVRKLPVTTSLEAVADFPCTGLPAWPCTRFVLVASQLSASGSSYSPLAEFTLAA